MSLLNQVRVMLDSGAKDCIGLCTRNTYGEAWDHLALTLPPEAVFQGERVQWGPRSITVKKLEDEPLKVAGAELFLLVGVETLDPAEAVGYGRWTRA